MLKSIEEKIKFCNKCGKLDKLSCDTIKLGKSRILILGESPAKDGWIVTGKAFYNSKGKLQASGKVLQELLKLCDLTIEDINFSECCKCVIPNRNMLGTCINNCREILFNQLEMFDCDIIIPMGKYPTEAILNVKIDTFKNYVGKEYYIECGKNKRLVIPIYHTSPANPLCYKGNVEIFKKINEHISDSK